VGTPDGGDGPWNSCAERSAPPLFYRKLLFSPRARPVRRPISCPAHAHRRSTPAPRPAFFARLRWPCAASAGTATRALSVECVGSPGTPRISAKRFRGGRRTSRRVRITFPGRNPGQCGQSPTVPRSPLGPRSSHYSSRREVRTVRTVTQTVPRRTLGRSSHDLPAKVPGSDGQHQRSAEPPRRRARRDAPRAALTRPSATPRQCREFTKGSRSDFCGSSLLAR